MHVLHVRPLSHVELEELIASPTADRGRAMESFRKARTILNGQVSTRENRHYPFRVAANYAPFLTAHLSILKREDREEVARAARFILRRIEGLSPYRANHRYVVDCRYAMEQILKETPITDA